MALGRIAITAAAVATLASAGGAAAERRAPFFSDGCVHAAGARLYRSTYVRGDGFEVLGRPRRTVAEALRIRNWLRAPVRQGWAGIPVARNVFETLRAIWSTPGDPARLLLRRNARGGRRPLPIYVVPPGSGVSRGVTTRFCTSGRRRAPRAILVESGLTHDPEYGDIRMAVVTHELVHVFQDGAVEHDTEDNWFIEATAEQIRRWVSPRTPRVDELYQQAFIGHPDIPLDLMRNHGPPVEHRHARGAYAFLNDLGYSCTPPHGRALAQAIVHHIKQILRASARGGDVTRMLYEHVNREAARCPNNFPNYFAAIWAGFWRDRLWLPEPGRPPATDLLPVAATYQLSGPGQRIHIDLTAAPLTATRAFVVDSRSLYDAQGRWIGLVWRVEVNNNVRYISTYPYAGSHLPDAWDGFCLTDRVACLNVKTLLSSDPTVDGLLAGYSLTNGALTGTSHATIDIAACEFDTARQTRVCPSLG